MRHQGCFTILPSEKDEHEAAQLTIFMRKIIKATSTPFPMNCNYPEHLFWIKERE